MRKSFLIICAFVLTLLLVSCGSSTDGKLVISDDRSEAQYTYYVGDTFDSYVSGDAGAVCRIPEIYVQNEDGTLSEDVSHSENTVFSGYDLTRIGKQTVRVTYTTKEGKKLKASYPISVVEDKILFIKADDNMHLTSGAFRVGEKFTTYQTDEYGFCSGVTVWLHMDSQISPRVGYFANEEKMREASFDTSECKLDSNGCFTEAGTFSVKVSFRGFETSYSIKVIE